MFTLSLVGGAVVVYAAGAAWVCHCANEGAAAADHPEQPALSWPLQLLLAAALLIAYLDSRPGGTR